MKHFIIILSIFCLFSCSQELINEETEFEESDVFTHLTSVEETITFSGHSELNRNLPFSGSYVINAEKTSASGILNYGDDQTMHFKMDIPARSLQRIAVASEGNSARYKNIMGQNDIVEVSDLQIEERKISGSLSTESLKMNFDLERSEDPYAANSRFAPLVIWAIAGAAATLTTVGTCAYERTAAREACQVQHGVCLNSCMRHCQYSFETGLCGGDCDVTCEE